MNYRIEDGWVIDQNNNRARISFWGDEAKAKASLQTLMNCTNCTNCTYCTNCTDCAYCTNCTDCAYCTDCRGCTDCTGCTGCTDCTGCRGCTDCTGCTGCRGCTYCTDKIDLFRNNSFEAPKVENLHQRVYTAVQVEDSFDMRTWHKGKKTPEHPCGTTHCWAGHIVLQAGAEGMALEKETSSEFAAMQIAKASGLPVNPAHFFDMDNARSLKRIEEMAKRERASNEPT